MKRRDRRALLKYARWWRGLLGPLWPYDKRGCPHPWLKLVLSEYTGGLSAFYSPRRTPLDLAAIAESLAYEGRRVMGMRK